MQLAELDWMVCNGGADIWHLLPARGDKEAAWAADEQWDAHISFRHGWIPLGFLGICSHMQCPSSEPGCKESLASAPVLPRAWCRVLFRGFPCL